jgi:hypothetical protein
MSVSSVIDFSARITKMNHMNGTTEREGGGGRDQA